MNAEWRFQPKGGIVGAVRRDPVTGQYEWRTQSGRGYARTFREAAKAAKTGVRPRVFGFERRIRDWALDRWLRLGTT